MASTELRKIERVCRKVSEGLKVKIQIIEQNQPKEKHADAAIEILGKNVIVILEITGRVTLSDELEKLTNTCRSIKENWPRVRIIPAIHYRNISSVDRIRLLSKRIGQEPIITMKCTDKLKDILRL